MGNIKTKPRDNDVDLNTLTETQGILVGTANANKPSAESSALGLVLVLKVADSTNAIWQFYSRWSASDYLYFRSKTETGWGSWIKLT